MNLTNRTIGSVRFVVYFTLFLLLAAGGLVQEGTAAPANEYQSDLPDGIERPWIGPEYWANRLQDWRLSNGRIECIEGGTDYPMRTLHLLTTRLSESPGSAQVQVTTGAVQPGEGSEDTWTGFLIGPGGADVDYRRTAMVYKYPAEDGGMVVGIDGTGEIIFRDNTRGGNLPRALSADSREGPGFDGAVEPVVLTLEIESDDLTDYTLTVTARDPDTDELVHRAVLEDVPANQVEGGLGLVSHYGPQESGYWFDDWQVTGSKVLRTPDRSLGPIMSAQHTLSEGTLNLTAQMAPMGGQDTKTGRLQVRSHANSSWETVDTAELQAMSSTFEFQVPSWDDAHDVPYRVAYELATGPNTTETHYYTGTIRKNPTDQEEITVAGFTGNKNFEGDLKWNKMGIWFPHQEIVDAVKVHDPDVLFFSGDQIYEGDLLAGADTRNLDKQMLDYLYKWYRWCWSYKELTRDIPVVAIPDDHDVYHGNIWGAGGRHAETQDAGGYLHPPEFVNAVQQTQTSHLPDPYDPTPVKQGITVYYADMNYGGVSFAILEDRKWKSSPTVAVPEGDFDNGWPQAEGFDPATEADVPGAKLLGERQLNFLDHWANDWRNGVWMKAALSQTIFSTVTSRPKEATSGAMVARQAQRNPLPPDDNFIEDERLADDADSGGWPQTGRDNAIERFRKAFAVHISGDQHLGSTVHYGIDHWHDASFGFCVPSVGNTHPRRWYPPYPGLDRKVGDPPYTGNYKDAFGNLMTVLAVANPVISGKAHSDLYDRSPGYGIVEFNRRTREITMTNWPRWVNPANPNAQPYLGWPITVSQSDNYGRKAEAWLPTIQVRGMKNPVVQVIQESTDEVIYTIRIQGSTYRPKVFEDGSYTVKVGEQGTEQMKTLEGLESIDAEQALNRNNEVMVQF